MQTFAGSCHCGAVAFEVGTELADPVCCNCSFCIRRGAVLQRVPDDRFHLLRGDEALCRYGRRDFSDHFFCGECGIHVFTRIERANERSVAVNLGCLPEIELAALAPRLFDGASRL